MPVHLPPLPDAVYVQSALPLGSPLRPDAFLCPLPHSDTPHDLPLRPGACHESPALPDAGYTAASQFVPRDQRVGADSVSLLSDDLAPVVLSSV